MALGLAVALGVALALALALGVALALAALLAFALALALALALGVAVALAVALGDGVAAASAAAWWVISEAALSILSAPMVSEVPAEAVEVIMSLPAADSPSSFCEATQAATRPPSACTRKASWGSASAEFSKANWVALPGAIDSWPSLGKEISPLAPQAVTLTLTVVLPGLATYSVEELPTIVAPPTIQLVTEL